MEMKRFQDAFFLTFYRLNEILMLVSHHIGRHVFQV